jgi:hypothetical protein
MATARLSRAAPMRFLIGVTALWTLGRGVALFGWQPPEIALSAPGHARRSVGSPPLLSAMGRPSPMAPFAAEPAGTFATVALIRTPTLLARSPEAPWQSSAEPLRGSAQESYQATQLMMLAAYMAPTAHVYRRATGIAEAATTAKPETASDRRLSGSAWVFARGGGRASSLSPGGQIGGGQAGARILYRVDPAGHLSVSGRISAAIGGMRQTEAAAGLDWQPVKSVPIHLMAERRIAIDRGGRNAWTLGAAGGVYDIAVAPGWRLDAYGEAGVVGAHRRDLYADGAARIARAIGIGHGASLAVGAGIWGAAQPGAARLDVGPSVVLRLPVEQRTVAVALDWRERMAGDAKPGSGVALTVATDF